MKFKPKTKLRVAVLVHQDLLPPETLEGVEDTLRAAAVAGGKASLQIRRRALGAPAR